MMTLLIVVACVAGYLFCGAVTARAIAAHGVIDVHEDGDVFAVVLIWPCVAMMAAVAVTAHVVASFVRGGDDR